MKCQDIDIEIQNLDWMGLDDEVELPMMGDLILHESEEEQDQHISQKEDLGPTHTMAGENFENVCGLFQKTMMEN